MRRKCAFLTVLGLSLCLAAGCSGNSDSGEEQVSVQVDEDEKSGTEEDGKEVPDTAEEEIFDFEEMMVLDTENCTVKITAIDVVQEEYLDRENFTLTVNMENKSPDKTYQISTSETSVNGLVTSGYFYSGEILPEKKANEKVEINLDALKGYGVEKVTDVELSFYVTDTENYDIVDTQIVHVYPFGEEEATVYERESQETDVVFADNEYLKGTVVGYEFRAEEYSDEEYYMVDLFLQNPSDKDILYEFSNMSLNGYMLEPQINYRTPSIFIPAGECGYVSLVWDKATLEENGIAGAEALGFSYEAESYNRADKSLVDDRELLLEETISTDL